MRAYSISGSTNAASTGPKTALAIVGASTVRPRVYDVLIGNSQTPADYAQQCALSLITTSTSIAGTTPTITKLDPNDVASLVTPYSACTAEPSVYGGNALLISLNARATFRWVASSPMDEVEVPATALNGAGVRMISATGSTIIDCTMLYHE